MDIEPFLAEFEKILSGGDLHSIGNGNEVNELA
jgi:hypothetical protein